VPEVATPKPTFFTTPSEFHAWLEQHQETVPELWVGFHKKSSGRPSVTWPESVEQALCFGWIDGVRRSVDDSSYVIRFTPRKRASTWSRVNVEKVEELKRRGLMRPAGLRAFEQRSGERSGVYSYERREAAELPDHYLRRLRANRTAWKFFEAQPDWYRKSATWWVVSAKREETRVRRLMTLIDDSEHGRTIRPLTRPTLRRR
jgi:uncharacterized protein YdeI (YjbR/CyaY-like superfamily)